MSTDGYGGAKQEAEDDADDAAPLRVPPQRLRGDPMVVRGGAVGGPGGMLSKRGDRATGVVAGPTQEQPVEQPFEHPVEARGSNLFLFVPNEHHCRARRSNSEELPENDHAVHSRQDARLPENEHAVETRRSDS